MQFLETLEPAVLPRPSLHESEPIAASASSQTFIVSQYVWRNQEALGPAAHFFQSSSFSVCVLFFKGKKNTISAIIGSKITKLLYPQKKKKIKNPHTTLDTLSLQLVA